MGERSSQDDPRPGRPTWRVVPMTNRLTASGPALLLAFVLTGCATGNASPSAPPSPLASAAATDPSAGAALEDGSIVLVGRIVTMADPPIAEAVYIEDGVVAAIGTSDAVLAQAGDDIPVVDI